MRKIIFHHYNILMFFTLLYIAPSIALGHTSLILSTNITTVSTPITKIESKPHFKINVRKYLSSHNVINYKNFDDNIYNFTEPFLFNDQIRTIYFEDFEDDNGGWTVFNAGTGSSWTWGVNNFSTSISETGEGNFWYTNNYNDYDSNSHAYVTSPVIDLSGWESIELSIDIRRALADYNYVGGTTDPWARTAEDRDDGFNIEYSTDGTTWNTLGSQGEGSNWYNANVTAIGDDGWTDASTYGTPRDGKSRFETATISLPAVLENNATVQFRVRFQTDGDTNNFDGANFDNIIITGSPINLMPEPALGPGDVNDKLRLWLKSNSGISVANGDGLDIWNDQAEDNNAISVYNNSQPIFKNNKTRNINFNPVVDFDRSSLHKMRGKGGYFSKDYFIAFKTNDAIDNSSANRQMVIAGRVAENGYSEDGTGLALGSISARYSNELIAHTKSSFPNGGSPPNESSYGRAYRDASNVSIDEVSLINIKTNSSGTASEIYYNGKKIDNITGRAGNSDNLNFSEWNNIVYNLGVGRFSLNGNIDAYFDGRLMEVISYAEAKSSTEQQKIYSYLAIKNGVALHKPSSTTDWALCDQDYLDSSGNIIWNATANSGHNYNVAGIGRDDNSGLNQKQSKSEHKGSLITMSLTDLYETNNANPNTFREDKDFLMWGHDNAPMAAGSSVFVDMSAGIPGLSSPVTFNPITRIWKVVESKQAGVGVPKVKVSIAKSALTSVITPPGAFLMFISDAPFFDPSAEYRVMSENGANLETTYDFNGTKYITFGYAPEEEYVRSVYFDGSQDYMDMDDNLDLANQFSLSAWVKYNNSGTILSKCDAAYTEGYELRINSTNKLNMRWKVSGTNYALTSNTSIPTNEWHHVAVTYSGNNLSLYIDGILDKSATRSVAPINTDHSFLVAASGGSISQTRHIDGNIDEVRIWDNALSIDQIRYIMNQEIIEHSDNSVDGIIIPQNIIKNEIAPIPWNNLRGYYPMTTYTFTNVKDASGNGVTGALKNLETVDYQTAPLPYVSQADGAWTTNTTWLNNSVQTLPHSASIVDGSKTVDWNIVRTNHNITTTLNRTVLGLMVESNTLSASNNKIEVTHYLELDGTLDLAGESQLIQTENSELASTSEGFILRRQQGNADLYNYNYWSSPVSPENSTSNNTPYTIKEVLKDENSGSVQNLYYSGGYNGAPSTPATVSSYWLYTFRNQTGDYANWESIGESTALEVGQGFTLKGPGSGSVTDEYDYVFRGKPNNSDSKNPIELTITSGNSYLIGNPFPSAIDAHQFIDNNPFLTGTLYFWEHWGGNSHILKDYQAGYATVTKLGEVKAMGHPDVSSTNTNGALKTPGRYIAVGQGFFVEAASNGVINFNNNTRAFVREDGGSNSIFLANEIQPDDAANDKPNKNTKLWLGFYNKDNRHRELLLGENPNTTLGYDRMYDGKNSEELSDDMNWDIEGENYVIQGIKEITEHTQLPLTVHVKETGSIKIALDSLSFFKNDLPIGLKDNQTGTITNLRNSTYTTTLQAGDYPDRYVLIFKLDSPHLNTDDIVTKEDIVIFYRNYDSQIVISNNTSMLIESASLYSILGQEIKSWKFEGIQKERYLSAQNLSTGTYILKVNTNRGTISQKLIIN